MLFHPTQIGCTTSRKDFLEHGTSDRCPRHISHFGGQSHFTVSSVERYHLNRGWTCVVEYNEEFGRTDRFHSTHADETRCSLAHAVTKGVIIASCFINC